MLLDVLIYSKIRHQHQNANQGTVSFTEKVLLQKKKKIAELNSVLSNVDDLKHGVSSLFCPGPVNSLQTGTLSTNILEYLRSYTEFGF